MSEIGGEDYYGNQNDVHQNLYDSIKIVKTSQYW